MNKKELAVKNNLLLGLDLGTTSFKGVITDLKGNVLASHAVGHTISQPRPGWVEQDPETIWWGELVNIVNHLLLEGIIDPDAIAAISIGGFVPSLCPLDERGSVVRPAILYRDNRAVEECREIDEKFGTTLDGSEVIPKLLWMKNHEPDNYQRISMVLNAHSYLIYKLTGLFSNDCDTAHILGGIFNGETGKWDIDRMKALGLNPDVLPPVYGSSEVVGRVTEKAASETGLTPGIPVIAGNGDSFMSLLGAGVVDPGDGMIYLGTAGTMFACSGRLDASLPGPVINSGNVQFIANILTGGELLRWFREFLQISNEPPDYKDLMAAAEGIPPGSEGLIILPHLMGERTPVRNPLMRGTILGLTTAHGGEHIFRALMEGFAYALKHSYEQTDCDLKRVVIMGGGAKDKLWRQIICDVLGLPLEYVSNSDAAKGNAYFAGFSMGLFSDFNEMKQKWVKIDTFHSVDETKHLIYKGYYNMYKQIYSAAGPLFASLYQLQKDNQNSRSI